MILPISKNVSTLVCLVVFLSEKTLAFSINTEPLQSRSKLDLSFLNEEALISRKKSLLSLLRVDPIHDEVLADPVTKEDVRITLKGTILADNPSGGKATYEIKSPRAIYKGSSNSYIDLLEQSIEKDEEVSWTNEIGSNLMRTLAPLVPPPLRMTMSTIGFPLSSDYIPMRDLFTSPAVSYAYERGWRQGFERAGFPGPDREAELAMKYFESSMTKYNNTRVLVDMSCATGLFTRRFAKSGKYKRVLGCDYSATMLQQARKFIDNDTDLKQSIGGTKLDLVRLDVGQIPMKDDSVDALHAGAAMHCWPDLPSALSEIRRVLKPGGRYFATTFLSSYFSFLSSSDGLAGSQPSLQAFQYFNSIDDLRTLLTDAGFSSRNISIEILGNACVVIRCEK